MLLNFIMSTKITPKVKNQVWQDYTKNSNSKNELKQMFLGKDPTNAYKKISLKLKKKLDQVKVRSSPLKKTLRSKIPKIKSPKKSLMSPSKKSKRISSPNSPTGPKRRLSPTGPTGPNGPKRRPSSPSKKKLVKSPSRKSKKNKLSEVRLIKN